MKTLQNIILATLITGLLPFFTFAQTPDPCPDPGTFGCFEVGLPGIETNSIDSFLDDPKPILKFTNLAVKVVIAALVIIGVISVVIGGYIYMTAGGDGGRVKLAKEMIVAALVGILLSLISVVILNTINKYLGSEAQEPTLGTSPAPAAGGTTNTAPQNPTGTNPLPGSTTINQGSVATEITSTQGIIDDFFNGTAVEEFDAPRRNALRADLDRIDSHIRQLPNQSSTAVTQLFADNAVLRQRLNELSQLHGIP